MLPIVSWAIDCAGKRFLGNWLSSGQWPTAEERLDAICHIRVITRNVLFIIPIRIISLVCEHLARSTAERTHIYSAIFIRIPRSQLAAESAVQYTTPAAPTPSIQLASANPKLRRHSPRFVFWVILCAIRVFLHVQLKIFVYYFRLFLWFNPKGSPGQTRQPRANLTQTNKKNIYKNKTQHNVSLPGSLATTSPIMIIMIIIIIFDFPPNNSCRKIVRKPGCCRCPTSLEMKIENRMHLHAFFVLFSFILFFYIENAIERPHNSLVFFWY